MSPLPRSMRRPSPGRWKRCCAPAGFIIGSGASHHVAAQSMKGRRLSLRTRSPHPCAASLKAIRHILDVVTGRSCAGHLPSPLFPWHRRSGGTRRTAEQSTGVDGLADSPLVPSADMTFFPRQETGCCKFTHGNLRARHAIVVPLLESRPCRCGFERTQRKSSSGSFSSKSGHFGIWYRSLAERLEITGLPEGADHQCRKIPPRELSIDGS